jgi:excisionase family DNA binding protein
MGDTLPELLTVEDAATMLRLTRKAAQNMIDRGQMPGVVRVGRRVRVRRDDLRRHLGLPGSGA